MSSDDSSSDSSSSSDERHRKRKHKKHSKDIDKSKKKKSKKHKKEKRRHKEKKRSRQEDERRVPNPQPAAFISPPDLPSNSQDAFGPALPPHLRKSSQPVISEERRLEPQAMIGPILPSNLVKEKSPIKNDSGGDDDDLAGTFGPLPNASQVALEERALALKLAALEGGGLGTTTDQDAREEWMLELPDVGLKSGLAALNNMKRTFYQGKERPDFSDRSSWTKTPQSETAVAASGPKSLSSKELEQMAQAKYEQQRDDEQESMAKKTQKKHKRDESLMDLHQKKLRKEQREKEKELAASGSKPERRPFSRDVDLKLNKIDKNQTKQIVDKAKILNTKFSRGQAKYL
ncbi:GPALPP motifs-containing protein 1 [Drosophila eugracilis]|uniref:GPALPP motifs-containing protein 1 n=1 Tax=Drosophila eugracilis TaxID=29029 RepID=UPI001BDACE7D|nr:GPALPP motifs-containing protein 1 [Drosophila eugracilis]